MKKLIVFFLILPILVLGALWFVGSGFGTGSLVVFDKEIGADNIVELDSDSDGLRDWEEAIWGTDPKNPDSDGDGTSDGDEIDAGRDPLKIPPDTDFVLSEQPLGKSKTDQLAKDFLEKYYTSRESGTLDRNKLTQEILDLLLTGISEKPKIENPYILSDLSISDITSDEAIKVHARKMAKIFNDSFYNTLGDEAQILVDAVSVNAGTQEKNIAIRNLKKAETIYNSISLAFVKVETPKNLASRQLELSNVFLGLSQSVASMIEAVNDPVLVLPSVKQYLSNAQILVQLQK